MYPVLVRVPNATGGTKVISIDCLDTEILWQLKVAIFSLLNIQPAKQAIFLPNENKELEVGRLLF